MNVFGSTLRFTHQQNLDFSMSFSSRLVAGALFALAPLSYTNAQNTGKILAMDFRTTVSVQGTPDSAVMSGYAVGTADKMRLDVRSSTSQLSPLGGDSV